MYKTSQSVQAVYLGIEVLHIMFQHFLLISLQTLLPRDIDFLHLETPFPIPRH